MDKAAHELLTLSKKENEENRRIAISNWLTENNIRSEAEYSISEGAIDLHLMHRHVIIEVKTHNKLNKGPFDPNTGSRGSESAFDQLTRYVEEERTQERLNQNKLQWLGAITDGIRWWVWEWPLAGEGRNPKEVNSWQKNDLNVNNMERLLKILGRNNVGKEWYPKNLANLFKDDLDNLLKKYNEQLKEHDDTITQKNLWFEQLKASGNTPTDDVHQLFVRHTLLTLVSRTISGMGGGGVSCMRGSLAGQRIIWQKT